MEKTKKSVFGALKESLIKSGCCGSTCTPASKQGAKKNTIHAKDEKKK